MLPSYIILFYRSTESFHPVIPLHCSAPFFFQCLDALQLCGSAVALEDIGEVGTSGVECQGRGSYALQFDLKMTAIHVSVQRANDHHR
jgi:hypothetical protein